MAGDMKDRYRTKYDVVADLYDVYVDATGDIPFWIKEASKESEVLELTAGTGRVTIPMSKAGIKVTTVDASDVMLGALREKAAKEKLRIKTHRADIRNFDLRKRFPLVVIPFNSIQEIIDPKDHKKVFLQVRKHLKATGRFIVTTHNSDLSRDSGQDTKFPVEEYPNPRNGRRIRFSVSSTIDRKTLTGVGYQRYEEYDRSGRLLRKRLFKNRYHMFDEDEFEDLVQSTGFRIVKLYGDYSYSELSEDSPFRIYELVRSEPAPTGAH